MLLDHILQDISYKYLILLAFFINVRLIQSNDEDCLAESIFSIIGVIFYFSFENLATRLLAAFFVTMSMSTLISKKVSPYY